MLNKSVLKEQINRPFPVCGIQLGFSFIIIGFVKTGHISKTIEQLLVTHMELGFLLK